MSYINKKFFALADYLNPKELSRIDTIRASILMSLQLLAVSALSFVCLREIISGDISGTIISGTLLIYSVFLIIIYKYFGLRKAALISNLSFPLLISANITVLVDVNGIEYAFFVFILTSIIFHVKWYVQIGLVLYNLFLMIFSTFYLTKVWKNKVNIITSESDQLMVFIICAIALAVLIYIYHRELLNYEESQEKLIGLLQKKNKALAIKNDQLERFTYASSHDLQSPFRTISSFAGLIKHKVQKKDYENIDESIDHIVNAMEKLSTSVSGMLEFAKKDYSETHPIPLDIPKSILSVLDKISGYVKEKNAKITFNEFPTVRFDPIQMEIVLQNLIENGIKYNQNDQPKIHIGYVEKPYVHQFVISDNGIGIDPQYYNKVFDSFSRLHNARSYGGSGLGLSLVKNIIEENGGKIWIENNLDGGSIFLFTVLK